MRRSFPVPLAVLVSLLSAVPAAAEPILGANLLRNPGFESTDGGGSPVQDGWVLEAGYYHPADWATPGPQAGTYFFTAGDGNWGTIYQNFDLVALGYDTDRLATGGYYATYGGYQCSWNEPWPSSNDRGLIWLRQFNSGGGETGRTDLGWKANNRPWQGVSGTARLNEGTTAIRYGFDADRRDIVPGGNNDAYLDSASLTLQAYAVWTWGLNTKDYAGAGPWSSGDVSFGTTADGGVGVGEGAVLRTGITRLGQAASSQGTAYVKGGTWYGLEDVFVGNIGTGEVNASAGGQWNTDRLVLLGNVQTARGTVNLADATWNANGEVIIGYLGTGEVNVAAGGQWNTRASVAPPGPVQLGLGADASGTVNLSKGTWTADGDVLVGGNGTGVVNVNAGGQWHTRALVDLGFDLDGTGTVNLNGGTWTADGDVLVGGGGAGTVNLNSGTWNATGPVVIGQGGTGTVDVAAGAMTVSGSPLTIGATGTLIFDGGRVTCATFDNTHGGTFDWNAGTLALTGGLAVNSTDPFRATGGDSITAPRTLEVAGPLTIGAAGEVSLDGGRIACGSFENSSGGVFDWQAGTLALSGGLDVTSANPLGVVGGGAITATRTLEVAGPLAIGPAGAVSLAGGLLTCDSLDHTQGGTFQGTGGTLRLSTGLTVGGSTFDASGVSLVGTGAKGAKGGSGQDGGGGYPGAGLAVLPGGWIELAGASAVDLGGGNGGTGGSSSKSLDLDGGDGGTGGAAGALTVSGGTFSVAGTVSARGGAGGTGGSWTGSYWPGAGGTGGTGGQVAVSDGLLQITGALDVAGGAGGNSDYLWGTGGAGGDAGHVTVSGGALVMTGTLNAYGGDGANGGIVGYPGGDAGRGGTLEITGGLCTLAATFEARGGQGGQGKVDKPGGAGGNVRVLGGELVLRPGANIDLAGGAGPPAGADGSMILDGGTLVLDGVGLDEALVCGTFDWAAGTVRFPQDLTVDSSLVAGIPMGLSLGRCLEVGHAMTVAPGGSVEVGEGTACLGTVAGPVPAGQVRIEADGTLNLDGGRLLCQSFHNAAGAGSPGFNWTGGRLTFTGDLTIDTAELFGLPDGLTAGRTLEVGTGTLAIGPGGALRVDGGAVEAGSLMVRGGGRLCFDSGTVDAESLVLGICATIAVGFDFTLTDLLSGALTHGTVDLAAGTVEVAGGATAFHHGGDATLGRLHVADGSLIASGGSHLSALEVLNDGLLAVMQSTFAADGLTNHGQLLLVDSTVNAPVHNPVGKAIDVIGTVAFNGLVSGAGGICGSGTAVLDGGHSPGDSTAVVSVQGDLVYGPANTLFVELGGLLQGEYDRVQVGGDMTLDGALSASLVDGFALAPNQAFEILDVGGALAGQFAGLDEGGLVGTFGRDLFITYAAGDGNDVALFTIPEPATLALVVLGGLSVLGCRRRR